MAIALDIGGNFRIDRAPLRSPVKLDDGSVRFTAVLARASVPMDYGGGRWEQASEAALRDRVYLDSLRGLGVTRHHPRNKSRRLDVRRDPIDARVGTVLGAEYDEGERAVVVEYVVNDPETVADILSGRYAEVSEGYLVPPDDLEVLPSGIYQQGRRIPNHMAVAPKGRLPGARTRIDEAGMDDDETTDPIAARVDALFAERLDAAMSARMDAWFASDAGKARMDSEFQSRMDALQAAAAPKAEDAPPMADADVEVEIEPEEDDVRTDEAVAARLTELREIDDLARRAGVDAPVGETRPARAVATVAKLLGAPDVRCDESPTFARGWIEAHLASPKARTSARQRIQNGTGNAPATTTPPRKPRV